MATASATRHKRRKQRYELQRYKRLHGDSGVIAYMIGRDYIVVQFNSGETYLYTYKSAGRDHIEAMKQRAVKGSGLSVYISQHPQVRHGFAAKLTTL